MFSKFTARTLRILILLGSALFAQGASATFHLWQLSELYSDASGAVQYIELSTFASTQEFVAGHGISASQGATSHTFNLATNLPGDSGGRKFLIGTQGFANLGIVTPDYIVPNGFLFLTNGSVDWAGVDSVTYSALPTDGVHALARDGSIVPSAPINFAGASGGIPAPAPVTYQGLWWNPNESGWGMSIAQQGPIMFVGWYTYDQAGNSTRYFMSDCAMSGNGCSGSIFRVSGGATVTMPWNGHDPVTAVGSGTLTFTDANTGVFNFELNGVAGTKNIARLVFGTAITAPAVDYTSLWWNPSESGWGVFLSHEAPTIFAVLYTYDDAGNPLRYTASSCAISGNGCSGTLYKTSGGSVPTVPWVGPVTLTPIGTITFAFADSSNAMMSFLINGVAGSKAISKMIFYTPPPSAPPMDIPPGYGAPGNAVAN